MGPATASSTGPAFTPAVNSGSEDSKWASSLKEPGFHRPCPCDSHPLRAMRKILSFPPLHLQNSHSEFLVLIRNMSWNHQETTVPLLLSGRCKIDFSKSGFLWFCWGFLLCFVCLFLPVSMIALAHTSGWSTLGGEELTLMQAEGAHRVCVSGSTAQRCRGALYSTQEGRLLNQPLIEWCWM